MSTRPEGDTDMLSEAGLDPDEIAAMTLVRSVFKQGRRNEFDLSAQLLIP